MNLSRRGFFGGLTAALVAAPAVVHAGNLMKVYTPRPLTLWGDGVHDDTAALQDFISGNKVKFVRQVLEPMIGPDGHKAIVLPRGIFATSAPLLVGSYTSLKGGEATLRPSGNYAIKMEGEYIHFERLTVMGRTPMSGAFDAISQLSLSPPMLAGHLSTPHPNLQARLWQ